MNPIPGISVRTQAQANAPMQRLQRASGTGLAPPPSAARPQATLSLGGWLSACLVSRYSASKASFDTGTGVTVWLEGYLTDIVGNNPAGTAAEKIATLYLSEGAAFLPRLRGSFSCLVADRNRDQALLFNDRLGSRPVFIRDDNGGGFAVGPEVSTLAALSPAAERIDAAGLTEFLISGTYLRDRTLYRAIKKLPQGSVITIKPGGHSVSTYAKPSFDARPTPASMEECFDECDALVRQAVRRVADALPHPVLSLSGGLDSRIILATLKAEHRDIDVAIYGAGTGDDANIARRLAEASGAHINEFRIAVTDPERDFVNASLSVDGRSETIDTPSLDRFFLALSERYESFLVGDVCLTVSRGVPLEVVESFRLSDVSRLLDWIRAEYRSELLDKIDATRSALLQTCRHLGHVGQTDCLYYHGRLANMHNGFAAGKLRYMEQGRPLLDDDLVDFLVGLPYEWRKDKFFLSEYFRSRYGEWHQLGYSAKDSLPTPAIHSQQFASNPGLAEFLRRQIIDDLDTRLADILDKDKLEPFLANLLSGKPFPPVKTHWLLALPGMWRFAPKLAANHVHPVTLLMRLLQVQLYLAGSNGQGPSGPGDI